MKIRHFLLCVLFLCSLSASVLALSVPVGDYDANFVSDPATWDWLSQDWYVTRSDFSTPIINGSQWGVLGSIPVMGD